MTFRAFFGSGSERVLPASMVASGATAIRAERKGLPYVAAAASGIRRNSVQHRGNQPTTVAPIHGRSEWALLVSAELSCWEGRPIMLVREHRPKFDLN